MGIKIKGHSRITTLLVMMLFYLRKADGAKPEIAGNSPRGTVRTINVQAEDGADVIDCVDIYKQPSLDHPLLKNHTIQMRPTSYPTELLKRTHDAFAKSVFQTWSENEECPDGTVPIRRTYKEINESISRVWRRNLHFTQLNGSSNQPMGNAHKFAVAFQRTPSQERSGVAADLNVWNPKTKPGDYSMAQLWLGYVVGARVIEAIEAGWEVYPQRYHSNSARLFILFTTNGYTSYCYNLDCPGFILVDKSFTLGAGFNNVSSYKGAQYVIDIALVQDWNTKNLWFYYGGKHVGYWPRILFKYIADGGNIIAWGGEVFEAASSKHLTSTAMGSGHFPEEGFRGASYIGRMRYLEKDRMAFPNSKSVSYVNTNWKSYHALPLSNDQQAIMTFGQHFYFGGPGGH